MIKKTMCHHTLKCVVCDRHLFLGCSEMLIHTLKNVVFANISDIRKISKKGTRALIEK